LDLCGGGLARFFAVGPVVDDQGDAQVLRPGDIVLVDLAPDPHAGRQKAEGHWSRRTRTARLLPTVIMKLPMEARRTRTSVPSRLGKNTDSESIWRHVEPSDRRNTHF